MREEYETYGCLYDWETACDICPDGWHLPSDDEWKELEMYLGMSEEEVYRFGTGYSRGGNAGDYLKVGGRTGTNITGLNPKEAKLIKQILPDFQHSPVVCAEAILTTSINLYLWVN